MKNKEPKFWAYFESTDSYELMSHAQYLVIKRHSDLSQGFGTEYLKDLLAFKSLKAAKDYLLTNFYREMFNAKRNINDIRDWTAKENK